MTIDYDSATVELMTLRDFLRWTTSRFEETGLFFGHGTEDAFNDASQLILHHLNLPVGEVPELFLDARLTSAEKTALMILIKKRIEERVPVPYLTQEAWFLGLPFYVDERVLIPRSPFAELISDRFSPWLSSPDDTSHILDMCTGGGCIAIALAHVFPDADIDAVDISDAALEVAKINQHKHQLQDRLHLITSDLWQNLADKQYDLIVSNPPYVSDDEMADLPAEYRHEPVDALRADDNGLALVRQIIIGAATHLTENGLLFVEVGHSDVTVMETWPEMDFLWLSFEQGGQGIFMLTQQQCVDFSNRYH
ncbi:Protein-N(5)-glutamine methyltransferase PrmB, methylates LSU ribosomal protein L3p [Methylophaga frappieri]|uniref:Ribosomal protein uL3 glutamine methyltransferase n=1 Tax=Methylophaga frappieri (strain ATCC BAA-2434 / DSM 25690 / JAM7) TaxID=754477 RepID=I1YIT9_METFJ|nr:50S ribosomal protein L3 N(5)-glutamine methyltransferase [Methylophaga frappieri]AFJ02832.1 Protein-N(5)-glutamine methyltransferase PrmB, methylates LSU ribosomal protein L3p [Methylophaga frappieri]